MTVIRHGYVVLDAYFYPYQATAPHGVASVTKSITAALVGIAVDIRVIAASLPASRNSGRCPDERLGQVRARLPMKIRAGHEIRILQPGLPFAVVGGNGGGA
ncbi:MAG: serine hydrolase [Acidobacteriota bacterium]|nr:serine hydrolase [Acidobacteriota bacterium]